MPSEIAYQQGLSPQTTAFYCQVLETLDEEGIPYLVGGAYALQRLTGIVRHTKDLDLFVLPRDCPRALALFIDQGFRTEWTHPHWLGKVYSPDGDFADFIFSSGNGIVQVDEDWFAHARPDTLLQKPVLLCPIEETIWSKAFIMERERFDGADIAHYLRAHGRHLDWPRLLQRVAGHESVLLCHLILFGYIYPGERSAIPSQILEQLWDLVQRETNNPASAEHLCRGGLLSRTQYLVDLSYWGYQDARLAPHGKMSQLAVEQWTAAIEPNDKTRPAIVD